AEGRSDHAAEGEGHGPQDVDVPGARVLNEGGRGGEERDRERRAVRFLLREPEEAREQGHENDPAAHAEQPAADSSREPDPDGVAEKTADAVRRLAHETARSRRRSRARLAPRPTVAA